METINISTKKLTIESLYNGIPVIPEEAVGFYKQNCMVSFHLNGHTSGVGLLVLYNNSSLNYKIFWKGEITDQILRSYRDTKRVTDFAACTIALLLVRELTEFTAIEQSCLGTTIDYYLVPKTYLYHFMMSKLINSLKNIER